MWTEEKKLITDVSGKIDWMMEQETRLSSNKIPAVLQKYTSDSSQYPPTSEYNGTPWKDTPGHLHIKKPDWSLTKLT